MPEPQPGSDVEGRLGGLVSTSRLEPIADALATARDPILAAWLDAASRQPFHADHPDAAVADHIPVLFDAVVDFLRRHDEDDEHVTPMADRAIVDAAGAHAQARFEQGLGPLAIVTEFRLLRHEIARSIGRLVDEDAAPKDVIAGIAVLDDALDGAATIGLAGLSERIESLREGFLATTLHDVRQPITLVEGSLHLAERWLSADEPDLHRLRETMSDAISATSELIAMIDTMSDASRVALGSLDPEPEPVSLGPLVRQSIDVFGATARSRVHLEGHDRTHLVGLWDPRLIHRLVANLVGNALKYSGPEDRVEVTIAPGDAGMARLTVRDHGLGMTRQELDSVFERFARADRARRRGIAGLGLGLYACRGIVTAHGGTIRLASEGEDQGTTVVVELPLLDGDGEADAEGGAEIAGTEPAS